MAFYSYTALDSKDAYVRGRIEAQNERKAGQLLEREGFVVVNMKKETESAWQKYLQQFSPITSQDRIFFTRNLVTMLEAGIGIDQAVKTTAEQTTNLRFREVLMAVYGRLQEGQAFNKVLAGYPKFFPAFSVNLIRVGETSGKLHETLAQLLEQQEKDERLRSKARSAMIYPTIILVALVAMVVLMMAFVIPRVKDVLESYNATLPLTTRIVIAVSNAITNYGLIILAIILVLIFLSRRYTKTPRGQWNWHAFLLTVPKLRTLLKEFNIALYTRSMASLLNSGLSLDQALALTGTITPIAQYRKMAADGSSIIRRGVPLAEVMKGSPKLFTPLSIRMVEVGEKSGKLDHMLGRLATHYETSVETALTNLSAVIEPFLLLVIGLVVGFVAVSIMTPIWSFSNAI